MSLIHTLPGLWLSENMLLAAVQADSFLRRQGAAMKVRVDDRSYIVFRRSSKVLLVFLETDLQELRALTLRGP